MLNDDIFGHIQFEIMWQKKDNYFRGIIRMCEQVAASGNTLILYSA